MTRLNELFRVRSRFHRSVQVEMDDHVDGYVLTESGLKVIDSIAKSLSSLVANRAWSIIGPYGTGKSAFIVYLKNLLGGKDCSTATFSRDLLKTANSKLCDQFFSRIVSNKNGKGFFRSIVSASREPLEAAILKSLMRGLEDHLLGVRGKRPLVLERISGLLGRAEQGKTVSGDDVLEALRDTCEYLKRNQVPGLLMVIDELGKSLESAALNSENDIFILQKLAEFASRSSDFPILFFTVLHQSFDRYASKLESNKRNEWAKIQGRFEEVSFVDPSDQTIKLISSAIENTSSTTETKVIDKIVEPVFDAYRSIFPETSILSSERVIKTLYKCLPLHPLTAISLAPLFRSRFLQNERSLFAFLTSSESKGFLDFLSQSHFESETGKLSLFSLSDLYDYFVVNFGGKLFVQHDGKRWAEIEHALARTTDLFDRDVLKTIGMLNIMSDTLGIAVNDAAILCALDLRGEARKRLKESLSSLMRKSVVVFRRYSSSYAIWGGSDIDIEQLLLEKKAERFAHKALVAKLNEQFPLRPQVAKRHLFTSGTLRFFKKKYVFENDLDEELKNEIKGADGQILFCLSMDPARKVSKNDLQGRLNAARDDVRRATIIALPQDASRLLEAFVELVSLQSIRKETPALQGDPVARREIDSRLLEVEKQVLLLAHETFFYQNRELGGATIWLGADGAQKRVSEKFLSQWASEICDNLYSKAPVVKNEIINRSRISSSASQGRRALMEAMMGSPMKERLGIEGFGPEYSIYMAVCSEGRLHQRFDDGSWGFVREPERVEKKWRKVLEGVLSYLKVNSDRKVPVLELYNILARPPFGIREGLIPVILLAFYMAYENEFALFDQGTFLPKPKAADFELLARVPKNYEVQLCLLEGIKGEVFDQLVATFLDPDGRKKFKERGSVLQIVKIFCEFVNRLPTYVKKTRNVSEVTRLVRTCLLEAKEPAGLLYRDLPVACGLKPFDHGGVGHDVDVKVFIDRLRKSLAELQKEENKLFNDIQEHFYRAFNIDPRATNAKSCVLERAAFIERVTLDPALKALLVRVLDNLSDRAWLESIATVVTGRPPLEWTDEDLRKYEHEMVLAHHKIKKYEQIALEQGVTTSNADGEVGQFFLRSSVPGKEFDRIFRVSDQDKEEVARIEKVLGKFIMDENLLSNQDAFFSALSKIARVMKEGSSNRV